MEFLRLDETHTQREQEHEKEHDGHPLGVRQRPRWPLHQGEWTARGCYGFGVMTPKNARLRPKCVPPPPCASYTG